MKLFIQGIRMKKLTLSLLLVSFGCAQAASNASVVTAPGKAPYWGPLVGNPTDPNDSVILVQTSDVIVDLLEFTTFQGNSVAGLRAVVVAPYLDNVTIRNGTFKGLTGPAIVIGEGCTNITLDNLHALNCESGFLLEGQLTGSAALNNVVINNCSAEACNGVSGGVAYGLRLSAVNNFWIINSTFNDNDALTANNGFGVSIEDCTNGHIHTSRFLNNGGNALGAGVAVISSDKITFEDCIAKFNTSHTLSASSTGAGFYVDNSTEVVIDKSHATDNMSTAGAAIGITINGTTASLISHNQLFSNGGIVGYGLRDTTVNTANIIISNIAYRNATSGYDVSRTVGTFPVASATAGDFSAIAALGDYVNILLN